MASPAGRLPARWWRLRSRCVRQGAQRWRRRPPAAAAVPGARDPASRTPPAGSARSVAEPIGRLPSRARVPARPRLPRLPPAYRRRRRGVGFGTRLRQLPGRSSARARLRDGGRRLHDALSGTCCRRLVPATRANADRHALYRRRWSALWRRQSLSRCLCPRQTSDIASTFLRGGAKFSAL